MNLEEINKLYNKYVNGNFSASEAADDMMKVLEDLKRRDQEKLLRELPKTEFAENIISGKKLFDEIHFKNIQLTSYTPLTPEPFQDHISVTVHSQCGSHACEFQFESGDMETK